MDSTPPTTGIPHGRALADDLDTAVSAFFDQLTGRVLNDIDPDDPTARALVTTRLLTHIKVHTDQLATLRQEALRRLRYPDGDTTTAPARAWRDIGTAVGLTPTRAQQLAAFPGDRTAPRAPGAGRKPTAAQ